MQDVVHALKEICKKITYMLKGKREISTPKRAKKAATDKTKDDACEDLADASSDAPASPNARARADVGAANNRQQVWLRTPKQQERADRKYSRLPLPPQSIRRSVRPFNHTGTMTINDVHRYIRRKGPGGYHLAASDLPDAQLTTLVELYGAIDYLLQPEIDLDHMASYRTTWLEILARAERDLPVPEAQALINHSLVHIWDQVIVWGPLWTHWTYVFERFLARLTRKIIDRSGVY